MEGRQSAFLAVEDVSSEEQHDSIVEAGTVKLDDEKQFDLLVESISEASKHARNLLFVLVISSLYVLVAAYSGNRSPKLKLPVLEVEVPTSEFYAISPLIIFGIYMYMQIYVADLRRRLSIFDNLSIECRRLPSPRLVLYPWLLTFASPSGVFDRREDAPARPRRPADSGKPSLYVQIVSMFAVWLLGPAVIFTLWVRFIGHADPTSIIPCACLIGALYSLSPAPGSRRIVTIAITAVGFGLLVTTAASVPDFRDALALHQVWQYLRAASPAAVSGIERFGITVTYALVISMTLGKLTSGLILKESESRLEERLLTWWVEADSSRARVLTYVLETILQSGAIVQSLLVVTGVLVGIIVGIGRLIAGL